jgi:P-type conjugative transfer protein TrbJ
MKQQVKRTLAAAMCFFYVLTAEKSEAGGGLGGGATEMTQLMNNGELVKQVQQMEQSLRNEIQMLLDNVTMIQNQVTMIQDMFQNTAQLPNQMVDQVTGAIRNIIGSYNKMDGILGKLSNIDEDFYDRFYSAKESGAGGTSAGWIKNYSEEYFKLSEALEEQAKKTVESLKVSADDITDSSKLLETLSKNAASATGRNAILQAGNELLGFMGGELVKTRTLMTEQTKTYLDYAERERSIQDAAADFMRKDLDKWQVDPYTPVDWSNRL